MRLAVRLALRTKAPSPTAIPEVKSVEEAIPLFGYDPSQPLLIEEKNARDIAARFKELGYDYITLDIEGFRSGSMNEPLKRGK